MSPFLIGEARGLKGEITFLGDKSIAHRAIILGALARGKTVIQNFPTNQDCLSTLSAFQKLGIKIKLGKSCVIVFGNGLYGLTRAKGPIPLGESGTTLRLLLGVLAGQNFTTKLTAGRSLSQRPMLRVTAPLRMMGAKIDARRIRRQARQEEYPPITIRGGDLKPVTYKMPIASAQVKSAILLAGLYAKGTTRIIEPIKTRDHTERMLKLFEADIKLEENNVVIRGNRELVSPKGIYIPGDISSASFFIVAALLVANSRIVIKKASLNPSRMGIIRVLRRMGADIKLISSSAHQLISGEPMGNIIVTSSKLRGTIVRRAEIPSLIDELPILMVLGSCAKGKTILEGVEELRVKETDRISSMSENLVKMGARIKVISCGKSENIIIEGVKSLVAAKVRSFADHRTAMSLAVAGLVAKGTTSIDDIECINKSFPEFLKVLKSLLR